MMTEEEKKQKDKVATLLAIGLRPDTFRWNIQGIILDKSTLLKAVSYETKAGELIINLARGIVGKAPKEDSYQPGKTAVCLLCGSELPIIKVGNGMLTCCGQNMEIKAPGLVPT